MISEQVYQEQVQKLQEEFYLSLEISCRLHSQKMYLWAVFLVEKTNEEFEGFLGMKRKDNCKPTQKHLEQIVIADSINDLS